MNDYLDGLDAEMDRAFIEYTDVGVSTADGTGRIYMGSAQGSDRTTFVFRSEFEDLQQEQVDFVFSLVNEPPKFSALLDPTYVEGAFKTIDDISSLMGVSSNLSRTEFVLLQGLPAFDRELVMVTGETSTMNGCTVYASPSVGNAWVRENLGLDTFRNVVSQSVKIRAQNLYPSGDRICVTRAQHDGSVRLTFEHMLTNRINGLLEPLFGLGLFDQGQINAYLYEAQQLEDLIKSIWDRMF